LPVKGILVLIRGDFATLSAWRGITFFISSERQAMSLQMLQPGSLTAKMGFQRIIL